MDDLNFKLIDNDKEISCKILHYFSNNDNNYIIYTDYTYDKNGCANIYANKYEIVDNNINLLPIENDNEWDLINKEWNGVNNG